MERADGARLAASRTPARVIASRGEGRGARPRATDEQLVGVGQGVRVLPSQKESTRCGVRYGPEGKRAWGSGGARGGRYWRVGGRACAERTANMTSMVVTLDVSKLSGWLNARAPCRVERRACDAG
eukprot:scaffold28957_cov67-Phaeocystis_antarctica.AAC.3